MCPCAAFMSGDRPSVVVLDGGPLAGTQHAAIEGTNWTSHCLTASNIDTFARRAPRGSSTDGSPVSSRGRVAPSDLGEQLPVAK